MSSVRAAGAFEFHNIGDLTTTFTAPSSCPSAGITYQGVEAPGLPGQMMLGVGSCSTVDWDAQCTPNGEAAKSLYKSVADKSGVFGGKAYYDFHSPGLACPSAWETAGIVSFNDGSVKASGAFESTVFQYSPGETTSLPHWNFPLNALTSVLAPTETAIVCCPSGFTANPTFGCYSSIDISELAGSTGCAQIRQAWGDFTTTTETFEYYGATITYENARLVTSATGTLDEGQETTRTLRYTLNESGIPDNTELPYSEITGEALQGLEYVSFVYLVNSGEEAQEGDGEGDVSDGKSKGGSGEGGEDEDENGAQSVRSGSFTTIGVVAAVWAASFLAVCSL